MVKVSVIVPCYNAEKYIDNCMQHLVEQTIGVNNIEIILVDDASSDDGRTLSKLVEWEHKFCNSIVVVHLEENLRQGGARNVGLKYASGEYILYCDADDWLDNSAIDELYKIAKEYDADVVEFENLDVRNLQEACQHRNDEVIAIDTWEVKSVEERKENLMRSFAQSTLGCWNKLYRASLLKDNEIEYSEHVIYEEPALTYMVRFFEKKHVFYHNVLHYCLQRDDSSMHEKFEAHRFDNAITHEFLIERFRSKDREGVYKEEIDFIFWHWYLLTTISFGDAHGYIWKDEEIKQLYERATQKVEDIKSNRYYKLYLE